MDRNAVYDRHQTNFDVRVYWALLRMKKRVTRKNRDENVETDYGGKEY